MKAFCLALILVFSACSAAVAKTVDLTNEKMGLDVPDAWTVTQQPVDSYQTTTVQILSALDPQKTSAVEVLVCSNPKDLMANHPGLISSVKDSISNMIVARGGQIQFTSESKIDLNGVPAYQMQYTITSPSGQQVTARAYQLAANGKLYLISMRTLRPDGAADLDGIANSIRFSTPPELPKPPVSHRRLKIALAAGAAVVGVIVLVAIIIFVRRRREE
jgi:hypothetical protein